MPRMTDAVPSLEAPPPADMIELMDVLMGDGPVPPAIVARMLDPVRVAAGAAAAQSLREQDWPNLGRYQQANADVLASGARLELVFMGDSLTELWPLADAGMLAAGRAWRGISGQTTPQMLLRFQADVAALRPRAVHILGGANDIAGNTGPSTPYRVQCNIDAMVTLAKAQGIDVVLGLLPPSRVMPWTGDLQRAPWTALLNDWLRAFAANKGCALVDYHTALADRDGVLPVEYSLDGLHPNRRGYALMRQALCAVV